LRAGANRSENVAAFASRAAEREAEISVEHPTVATASRDTPKMRLRILPSFMDFNSRKDWTASFQRRFMWGSKRLRARGRDGLLICGLDWGLDRTHDINICNIKYLIRVWAADAAADLLQYGLWWCQCSTSVVLTAMFAARNRHVAGL
jgi:hypothetical protein